MAVGLEPHLPNRAYDTGLTKRTRPLFQYSTMAGKPDDTSTILKNFAVIFPAFYAAYYVIVLLLSAIVGSTVSGGQPFDHVNFDPGQGGQALGK